MKRLTLAIALGISTFCLTGSMFAQEEEVQTAGEAVEMTVIAGDETGGAPMIFATSENVGPDGVRSGLRIMSSPGTMNFVGGLGGEFNMPAPDPWAMLSNPSVQKDLELVGDQLKQVQELQSEFARQMKEQIGDFQKGGLSPDRLKGLPELMKKLREEQREQMQSVLLPHQVERLKQVAFQTHMKRAGAAGALTSAEVAEKLGMTEEQIERLKKRSQEIKTKLAEDMEKLKEKAQQELLMELTPDQRAKVKEMTGDKYEPQTKDWQESFNRIRRRPRRPAQNDDN